MFIKDGKDRSDRREKHKVSSGFLLVPAVMLSECQNSGKWLLTVVSFKDGGSCFPGCVNDFWYCRMDGRVLSFTAEIQSNFSVAAIYFLFVFHIT